MGVGGGWNRVGATRLGTALPLGLQAASLMLSGERPGTVSDIACLAALAGSLLFRVSFMGAGDDSASRPEVSFRFSQPENLPDQA